MKQPGIGMWLTASAMGLVSWWAMDLSANPPPAKTPEAANAKLQLKVFKLNHTDPEEMKAVLDQVLTTLPQPPLQIPASVLLGGGMVGGAGISGGLGMIGGGNVLGGSPLPTVAADMRTQSILVRAVEKELNVAADVVKVLDTPAGAPWPKVKSIGIFSLKHADPSDTSELLQQLGFNVVALVPPRIIISTDLESLPDLESAIRELDVPARKAAPAEKRKKLLDLDKDPGS